MSRHEKSKLFAFLAGCGCEQYFEKLKSNNVKYEDLGIFLRDPEALKDFIPFKFHQVKFIEALGMIKKGLEEGKMDRICGDYNWKGKSIQIKENFAYFENNRYEFEKLTSNVYKINIKGVIFVFIWDEEDGMLRVVRTKEEYEFIKRKSSMSSISADIISGEYDWNGENLDIMRNHVYLKTKRYVFEKVASTVYTAQLDKKKYVFNWDTEDTRLGVVQVEGDGFFERIDRVDFVKKMEDGRFVRIGGRAGKGRGRARGRGRPKSSGLRGKYGGGNTGRRRSSRGVERSKKKCEEVEGEEEDDPKNNPKRDFPETLEEYFSSMESFKLLEGYCTLFTQSIIDPDLSWGEHNHHIKAKLKRGRQLKLGSRGKKGLSTSSVPLVLDIGSHNIKSIFAGENFCEHFPNAIGRDKNNVSYYGDEILGVEDALVGSSNLSYPVRSGIVQNWDDLEKLIEFTLFQKMNFGRYNNNVNGKIILVRNIWIERSLERLEMGKYAELLFEKYGMSGLASLDSSAASFYEVGLFTGLSVDCGLSGGCIVPLNDGYFVKSSKKFVFDKQIGGAVIDKKLESAIQEKYGNQIFSKFNCIQRERMIMDIKEKLCFVADFRDKEEEGSYRPLLHNSWNYPIQKTYRLPDGRNISLGEKERSEVLESTVCRIAKLVFDTILSTDADVQPDMFNYIVLSGGSTMYPGYTTRLEKEISKLYVEKVGDKSRLGRDTLFVDDGRNGPYRKDYSVMGAGVLADLMKERNDFWVSKNQYEEDGAQKLMKSTY